MAKPPLETHKKIYPSHSNVECWLDWKVELSEKFWLEDIRRYNTKFYDPSKKKKKNTTPWLTVDLYEGAMVFIFLFLFRTNGKKEHLDESDFRHGYGNHFESAILKITWYQQEH